MLMYITITSSCLRERGQLRHGVPVARRGGHPELLLEVRVAELRAAVAVRRMEIDVVAGDAKRVRLERRGVERAHPCGGRTVREEGHVELHGVRLRLGERVAGDELRELDARAEQHADLE